MNIEDYIHPDTGEPTIPLDEPWKRRLWQDYLRRQARAIIEDARARLGDPGERRNLYPRSRIKRLGKLPKPLMVPRPGSTRPRVVKA